MVGAPKNPFEAAARKKSNNTDEGEETLNDSEKQGTEQALSDVNEEARSNFSTKMRRQEVDIKIMTEKRPRIDEDKCEIDSSAVITMSLSYDDDSDSSSRLPNETEDEDENNLSQQPEIYNDENYSSKEQPKKDFELAAMLRQILEIAKEGHILQSSFQKTGYSEEVFLSTIEKLALEIKQRSSELHHLAN
eukprot:gene2686-894_t